jgi:hypothetical protein
MAISCHRSRVTKLPFVGTANKSTADPFHPNNYHLYTAVVTPDAAVICHSAKHIVLPNSLFNQGSKLNFSSQFRTFFLGLSSGRNSLIGGLQCQLKEIITIP